MKSFQTRILEWYAKNKRDLPWRHTDDPYHVLVSEVMLQQTQVDRVIPKYHAFLETFPTVQDLAKAQPAQVITLWSGLGYNRRAINLYKAAQQITALERFPCTLEELGVLCGIGPYTASALLAFAFNKDVTVIDTNVRRIISRFFFAGKGSVLEIENVAKTAIPSGKSRDYHNALMDIGSAICTATTPKCEHCPLQNNCRAYKSGNQERYLKIAPPQKKFKGSNRQYRGLILKMLKGAPQNALTFQEIRKGLNKPATFIKTIIQELKKDGLLQKQGARVQLPKNHEFNQ